MKETTIDNDFYENLTGTTHLSISKSCKYLMKIWTNFYKPELPF